MELLDTTIFKGQQYVRGSEDADLKQAYRNKNYQYATSTHQVDHQMKPGLILFAKSMDDIVAAVKHAKQKGIAVAIRTGGHQYSGASSTTDRNILLDLSRTFQGPDDRRAFRGKDDDKFYVRTSVSWSLGKFNSWLREHNLFIPHGQCTHVHLGGHVQTGGVGQLSRAFGLFGDHVRELEIVDSNGDLKIISKATDPDLFWAVLGGSPGNFGVLTHFTLEVYHDDDYKGAKGLKTIHKYSKETMKNLADILCEMSDNPNFPQNYDLCVSVLSNSLDFKSAIFDFSPGLDTEMRVNHPEEYGEDGLFKWPAIIVTYAQWVPLKPGDVCDDTWFDRINTDSFLVNSHVEEIPMSKMTGKWIFRNIREFHHPYEKRAFVTNSSTLAKDGWPQFVTNQIDEIVEGHEGKLFLCAQLQPFGGDSQFKKNANNGTSYSWRDTTFVAVLDCFYDDEYKSDAIDWQEKNDKTMLGPDGNFCKEDRRMIWGSHGQFELDKVWDRYHESREKYEKLMGIRRRADPEGTFTPNSFCVRAAGLKRKMTNGFVDSCVNSDAENEEPAAKRRA